MKLRFPALLLAGLTLVACGGGEPGHVEHPGPGQNHEDPDITNNAPPVAIAGSDRVVAIGEEVELDGTQSSDPDSDPLSFAWEVVEKPSGSGAAFHDTESRTPRFIADKAGQYVVELTVSDGIASAKDKVTIRANGAPIADAGANQASPVGTEVILDGSGSTDPDGDALTYSWAFVSQPDGSTVDLDNRDAAIANFTPDVIGHYLVELTVNDGHAEASARVDVNVTLESGVETTVLYVSPSGNDAHAGTKSEPLETVAEAFTRAEANNDIKRFVLASGTYEEDFGHQLSRKLDIVGPAEGEPVAILKSAGSLFTAQGEAASLTLLRVNLESEGVALHVYDDASLSVTRVECEARGCIHGVELDDEQRPSGAVEVFKSRLSGRAAPLGGINLQNGSLTIRESTVQGFHTGIGLMGVSVFMRETTVQENQESGLSLVYEHSSGTVIEDSVFAKNKKGLYFYSGGNVTVRDTTINTSSERGIDVQQATGLSLDNVTITNGGGVGLYANNTGNKRVIRLRNTKVTAHSSHGIQVAGKDSRVDLGTAAEAGNNEVWHHRVLGLPISAWGIYDSRPAGATGAITLSQTALQAAVAPNTYVAPHCDTTNGTLCIKNSGNVVVVH